MASVIFARLSIRAGGTVDVCGVWRGKDALDREAERVRLVIRGGSLGLERSIGVLGRA